MDPIETTEEVKKKSLSFWQFLEQGKPYLYAAVGTALCLGLPKQYRLDMVNLWPSQAVTICSIIIAFMATSLTILYTAPQHEEIKSIKRAPDYFNELIRFHIEAIYGGVLAVISSLAVMVTVKQFDLLYKTIFFYVWLLLLILVVCQFLRVVDLMHEILKIKAK